MHLSSLIRQFGNPVKIVSDRGTTFTFKQFADFVKEHEIDHV